MSKTNATIEVEMYCSCGARLCNLAQLDPRSRHKLRIIVDACPACLERACSEGHHVGYEKGRDEGYKEGRYLGYEEGRDEAFG